MKAQAATTQRVFSPLAGGCLMLLALLLGGCATSPPAIQLEGASMGTTWHATIYGSPLPAEAMQAQLDARLHALTRQMSAWEPDSALSHFNRAPAGEWVTLPPDLFHVVQHALALAEETQGAYDPTVAPLVELWGFGPSGESRTRPPSPEAIASAQTHIGHTRLVLDTDQQRLLQPGGMTLDINSLGPGYGVDALTDVLRDIGASSFLIELGGEMRATGRKPDGHTWRIAVESPQAAIDANTFDTVVALEDLAIGTSGDYRVGFVHEGKRYSHTLDPRTGAPITHQAAAVSVIATTAMAADAYAAALLVLGPEEGWEFALTHNIAAIFTLRTPRGIERRATPAFERHRAP